MNLLIVESPAKCSKIKSFLGSGFTVEASYGHIRSIPEHGINVNETTFEPVFAVEKKKTETVKKLKALAIKADTVYLATDPDREGEAISWHLYDLLDAKSKKKCVRVTFNEITKRAVTEAIKNPRSIDQNLVDAQKARQVLDRLIGYKISPAVWKSVASHTSAGRVQSIALRLICDRQKEINAFKCEDYWFVDALLKCTNGEFQARVITSEKDNRYKKEKLATEDVEKLQMAKFNLDSIEKKVKSVNPFPPFDTASLQKACSSMFGWSATRTMQVAQALYEQGRQTYLRTDSFSLAKEALDEARDYISHALAIRCEKGSYLPDKPNHYSKKSSAASQEAHEAIRPTHAADEGSDLSGDEKRLYDLVRARFLACQMTPMLIDTVTYHVKASSGHDLVAHGQVVKFDGWFKVYPYSKIKDEMLPEAIEGDVLTLRRVESSKHTTQPPAKYNDGSLIEKMESEGIGRPSTRASILKALRDKGYVDQDGKAFTPTDLGMRVCDFLLPNFNDFFMDLKFTSNLEEDLDLIADAKKDYLSVVKPVYDFMMKKLVGVKSIKKEVVQTGSKCSVCKTGDIVEKFSRYGKFFSCNSWPKCKQIFVKNGDGTFSIKSKPVKEVGPDKCPSCSGEMISRVGKFGKFWGCSKYPKCRGMRKEDGTPVEPKFKRWKKSK